MNGVEKYLTDEVLRAAWAAEDGCPNVVRSETVLRAVLPGILAAHRAETLREVAETFDRVVIAAPSLTISGSHPVTLGMTQAAYRAAADVMRTLADQAVSDV